MSVNVCERCLTELVRDSSFECMLCVRRRACLFVNCEEEKGEGGRRRGVLQCLMKGGGLQGKIFFLFPSAFLFLPLVFKHLSLSTAPQSFTDLDR